MKIFVFSDVHANIYSLKAIENCEDFVSADKRYFLGDFVTFGPHTEDVVNWFKNKDVKCVIGNNDSYIVNGLLDCEKAEKSKHKLRHLDDVKNELSLDSFNFIKNQPKEYAETFMGKKFLFTHYAWESETEVKDDPRNLNDNIVKTAFSHINCDYIFYGHIHVPTKYVDGNKNMFGVGSCGTLYPAKYLVINIDSDIVVERKNLNYDVESFKKDLGKCEDFSRQYFYSIIEDELNMAETWKQ